MLKKVRLIVWSALAMVIAAVVLGAQVAQYVVPDSAAGSDEVVVGGNDGDRVMPVSELRGLSCPPLCLRESPPPPPGTCGGDAQIGLAPSTYVRTAAHEAAGIAAKAAIVRRATDGTPAADGKVGMVLLGMSSAEIIANGIKGLHKNDPQRVNSTTLAIGAKYGATAADWANPDHAVWPHARQRVAAASLSPLQVQAAWMVLTQEVPSVNGAMTEANVRAALALVKAEWPNIAVVYVSGHPYTGYANNPANPIGAQIRAPEPYVHHDSLLLAQLVTNGGFPGFWSDFYDLWADGINVNPVTGLSWVCGDFEANDGVHPSVPQGKQKTASHLVQRWKTDPVALGWLFQ